MGSFSHVWKWQFIYSRGVYQPKSFNMLRHNLARKWSMASKSSSACRSQKAHSLRVWALCTQTMRKGAWNEVIAVLGTRAMRKGAWNKVIAVLGALQVGSAKVQVCRLPVSQQNDWAAMACWGRVRGRIELLWPSAPTLNWNTKGMSGFASNLSGK